MSKGVGTKGTPLCSLQSTLLSVVFSVVCSLLSSGNCSATYTKQGRKKENREPTSRLKKRIIRNECEIDDEGDLVRVNRAVATVTERALQWRTNRMIDGEYHDFIASNLHLRVQIKNELYEISVRLMMKGI